MSKLESSKITNTMIICITIIIVMLILGISNYKNEELKQKQQNARLQENKLLLDACITDAKNSRTDLWNNNCIKQSDGNCTIPSDSPTVEWIEQRYEQDIKNCNSLYG